MKFKLILLFAVFSLIIVSNSCKKDSPIEPATDGIVPSDANGAFYMSKLVSYPNSNYSTQNFAMAWVGSYAQSLTVGNISANDTLLIFDSPQTTQYIRSFNINTDTITWSVTGNTAIGLAPFNYVDQAPFPAAASFTLPDSINLHSTLTIPIAGTGGPVKIIRFFMSTDIFLGSGLEFSLAGNTNSISITPAQMTAGKIVPGNCTVGITTVEYTSQIIGGKKYYFVKETNVTKAITAY